MFKSVYDTDNNGIVDGAEALDDGVTYVSAGEVRTHIADEAKHREIDDEGAGLTVSVRLKTPLPEEVLVDNVGIGGESGCFL